MMIVLTPDDFKKLSISSRQEVLSLLDLRNQSDEDDSNIYYGEDGDAQTPATAAPSPGGVTSDDVLEEEHVVDLTIDQARELVANISEKSQQTLRRFAAGNPVAIEDLIGEGRDYRDVTELKRSLVAAVKRRLRNITKNRLAVLFSSDRDKTRIKIKPLAAAALREVLNIPEPLPEFMFYDKLTGESISAPPARLQERLQSAWNLFSGRPKNGATIDGLTSLKHFADHGFQIWKGEEDWDMDGSTGEAKLKYLFSPINENQTELLAHTNDSGKVEIFENGVGAEYTVGLADADVPSVIAIACE